MTGIEWTDVVWNPTTGCDRVSPGCDHCYALTMAKRLKGMGSAKYQTDGDPRTSGPGFGAAMHPDALTLPLSWRKPRRVFVNSMSDLFHEEFSNEFIAQVFAVMALSPQHTFQVLTKRHGRMRSLLNDRWFADTLLPEVAEEMATASYEFRWPLRNLWLGVSTEEQKWADIRIPALLDTPAAVRWISAEPLLGPIQLRRYLSGRLADWEADLIGAPSGTSVTDGLDWVVVGGESGPGARPMHPSWARSLRDQCAEAGVPFLFKQWGAFRPPSDGDEIGAPYSRVGKKKAGRVLDGRTWDEYPAVAS